jgi:hypothetical protein
MERPENERADCLSDGLHLSAYAAAIPDFIFPRSISVTHFPISSAGNKFVWKCLKEHIEVSHPSLTETAVPFPFPYWASVDPVDLPKSFPGRSNAYNSQ